MEAVDYPHVYEWTIVNFSCWNSEVHGKVIPSPTFSLLDDRCGSFYLYPRDLDGCSENIVVQWKYDPPSCNPNFSGDLSLISSNGSLLCSQQIDRVRCNGFTLTFPLLKFGDLVAQIRKNEADHQDQLCVKLNIKCDFGADYDVKRIRTTIDVHDVSVKIPSRKFDEVVKGQAVQAIWIHLDDVRDINEGVRFKLYKKEKKFWLIQRTFWTESKRKIFVSTRTSVLNKDDAVLKTVDYELVFNYYGEEKTLISVTEKEVKEKHCSLFISVKIIPPYRSEFKGGVSIGKGIYLMPRHFLNSRRISLTDKESSLSNSKIASYCPNNAVTVLTKELNCLFQDQDFSDFQLNCGGVSLPVHKNILSARSPVFKRLLSSDMREAASGAVDIEDLDAPTLTRFLAFLYTGTVEDLQGESVPKLYYAADKYEVPSLKSECVSLLCASLSASNVSDVLSLADKHLDDQLTSFAHDFILRNYNEVLESSEWESFVNREPLLVAETLTQLGQKKSILSASTS